MASEGCSAFPPDYHYWCKRLYDLFSFLADASKQNSVGEPSNEPNDIEPIQEESSPKGKVVDMQFNVSSSL